MPSVLLDVGPVVSIVLVAGLVVLLRTGIGGRSTAGWPSGFLIFVVFLLITGGKAYYPAAFYPALLAAGAGSESWTGSWAAVAAGAGDCSVDHLLGDHAVADAALGAGGLAAVQDRNRRESGPGQ